MARYSRNVAFKPNGHGWILAVEDKEIHLSFVEAEDLFSEMLKRLPCIEKGIELAWDRRHQPWIRLVGAYVIDKDELVVGKWRADVMVLGRRLGWTDFYNDRLSPLKEAHERFGEIMVKEDIVDEASRKAARDRLIMLKAEEYCKEHGITMADFMREAMKLKRESGAKKQ